jgi:tetratricopeptide (TPR) repeat protein
VEQGCAKVDMLAARDSRLTGWSLLQIDCLTRRARIALARQQTGEALVNAGQALAAAQARKSGDDADRRVAIATIHKLIGDIQQQAGDRAAALSAWQTALNIWPKMNETPRQKAIRAELLNDLGRADEAYPLTRYLRQIGFKTLI